MRVKKDEVKDLSTKMLLNMDFSWVWLNSQLLLFNRAKLCF